MSEERLELARRTMEAWNSDDADVLADTMTADAEFVPAVVASVYGEQPIRGAQAMVRFREVTRETWEVFRIEPGEYRAVGEQVLMLGRVTAKGRGSGVELNQPIAAVFWFREGKVSRVQSYLDQDEAVEAASREAAV